MTDQDSDSYYGANINELDNILNNYKNKLINKTQLKNNLEIIIEDIKDQFELEKNIIKQYTYTYQHSLYNKDDFYKYIEKLLVENNGDREDKLSTGLLGNLSLSIDIDTNNVSICGQTGILNINNKFYDPFKKDGLFSIKKIQIFLKNIKKLINSNTKIILDLTRNAINEIDESLPELYTNILFKEWIIFFIEKCNISKENIIIKIIEEDCNLDKSLIYKIIIT